MKATDAVSVQRQMQEQAVLYDMSQSPQKPQQLSYFEIFYFVALNQ